MTILIPNTCDSRPLPHLSLVSVFSATNKHVQTCNRSASLHTCSRTIETSFDVISRKLSHDNSIGFRTASDDKRDDSSQALLANPFYFFQSLPLSSAFQGRILHSTCFSFRHHFTHFYTELSHNILEFRSISIVVWSISTFTDVLCALFFVCGKRVCLPIALKGAMGKKSAGSFLLVCSMGEGTLKSK